MPRADIYCGDAALKMVNVGTETVQCCVTSPPYFGLRDYGVDGQIGQEKTPDDYVRNLVEVFREVKRALRSDGTLWLNLGDSYAGGGGFCATAPSTATSKSGKYGTSGAAMRSVGRVAGLKSKDLIGIPWRVALALQADGWYLRSDIIWHKPSVMPESVTDRPTKSHEHIFLLTKAENYFYDADAIREQCAESSAERAAYGWNGKMVFTDGEEIRSQPDPVAQMGERWCPAMRNKRDVWTVPPANYNGAHFATYPPELIKPCILAGTSAHGCCVRCGAPYTRLVEKGEPDLEHQRACGGDKNGEYHGEATKDYAQGGAQDASATKARILAGMRERKTTGWKQTCPSGDCWKGAPPEVIPCKVLDPFGGSGTTGEVALELGRSCILIELNPANVKLCKQRCHITPGLQLA